MQVLTFGVGRSPQSNDDRTGSQPKKHYMSYFFAALGKLEPLFLSQRRILSAGRPSMFPRLSPRQTRASYEPGNRRGGVLWRSLRPTFRYNAKVVLFTVGSMGTLKALIGYFGSGRVFSHEGAWPLFKRRARTRGRTEKGPHYTGFVG